MANFLWIGVVVHLEEIDILSRIRKADTAVDQAFVAVGPDQTDQFIPPLRGNVVIPSPGVEPKKVGIVFLDQLLNLRKGFPLPILLEIFVSAPWIPKR